MLDDEKRHVEVDNAISCDFKEVIEAGMLFFDC